MSFDIELDVSSPCPTPFNLAEYVLDAGLQTPEKNALSILHQDGVETWTYEEIRTAILGAGTGLLRAGLSPGDRLLMRVGNSVEFPVAYLASIAVGIIPVPTSSQLTAGETEKLISIVEPHAILHDGMTPCPDTSLPFLTTQEMAEWHSNSPAEFERGDPNRLCYIIFTSGTSGSPRAVMHAHRAIWARRMMFDGWYGLTSNDRLLHAGAFNWTYTLGTGLMDPWTVGATALIPGKGVGHTDLPILLKEHSATIFAAAPGVYRNVLKSNLPDFPNLRHGLAAGEKLATHLRDDWRSATGTQIYEAFGMSECSTFISSSPSNPLEHAEALGKPQPGRHVIMMGDNGPVIPGETGVISIADTDPGLALGYFNADAAFATRLKDGWFLTGDLGQMLESGEILYQGRADDMMNAGGFRVSPLDVEAAMLQHPEITEAAATDIEIKPDVRVIALFYTADAKLQDDDLAGWADKHLARYKQPRVFRRVETLPRNANGKLMRRALSR